MAFVGVGMRLGACVLTEFDEDGFLRAQPEGLGDEPRVATYELLQPYGYMARPLDPEVDANGRVIQGQACSLMYWTQGDRNFAMLAGDPRPIEQLPALAKGEQMIYGPAANFARCKADGTVVMFTTTDGTFDGQSVYAEVAPDGITALTPWGKLQLNATGFHVLTASGARIDCGAIAGLPSPLDSLGSYLKIAADILQFEGAAISVGSASGTADQVAKATAVLAATTALNTAIAAVFAHVSAVAVASGVDSNPAVASAHGAAAAAVAAAAAAMTTAAAAIPSLSMGTT